MKPITHTEALPEFSWPTPPYASFSRAQPWRDAQACEVEGANGIRRRCLLLGMDVVERSALVSVPPSHLAMPLQFSQFRSLTLSASLQADPATTGQAFAELIDYRPSIDYEIEFSDGSQRQGVSVGQVETDAGLFLFEPLNESGAVQRLFIPREAYRATRFGGHIGKLLVAQQSVSEDAVERVAQEQQTLRERPLGEHLVMNEIVTPEELIAALEEQARMPMVKVGQALTALGLITPAELDSALEKQKLERSVPLGELLVRSSLITREELHTALARKMGYPVVDLVHFPIAVAALRRLPFAVAQRLNALPLLERDKLLVVAVDDPTQRSLIDELEFATRSKVVPVLATGATIARHLPLTYQRFGLETWNPTPGGNALDKPLEFDYGLDTHRLRQSLEQAQDGLDEEADLPVEQSDNSLVRLINSMIIDALGKGVSDIHIESQPGKRKLRIRFRKDGMLAPYLELPHNYRSALVARIKIMCDLDIAERRKPQDGKIDFSRFSPQHKLELRVATIPTHNGLENVVLRLLASAKPVTMDQLGLHPRTFKALCDAVDRPYGMVLCVGPTGSGKTTTLHAVLGYLNRPEKKIWTAEDPIEITQPDLCQVQVNPKIDWTFAKALRSFLRADPDVIMVGEIRDQETAQIAIEASLTGHLLLSTLHTNSAAETVVRLLDMGMDPFNFADSLLAVLAQRLVRRLCPDCRQSADASEEQVNELLDDYLHAFPDARPERDTVLADWLQRFGKNGRLQHCHAPGCDHCDHTGLRGRLGVHELLMVSADIRRLIQTRARPEQILHEAMQHGGMRTLRQDGIEKVLAGQTTLEEIRANCN